MNNFYNYLKKNINLIRILFLLFILIIILYNNKNNKNVLKGGKNNCNLDSINSLNPTENNVVIYYAGKIYDIKKSDLTENQKIYFTYLQDFVKEGNMYLDDEYKVQNYKDLTKFFNYYELHQKENKDMTRWKKLYENKYNILNLLKNNLTKTDNICLNNLKL